ncbi:hypothetical protein EJB05_39389 [Eragrostis curvula]|uniref:Uncharacterized protein n=1 Tax=Eragrostis curvula TaxID=38414 RepID=A0A5J9TYB6_9POAL|nr:hypothetical protein EJB05_39389 [Eragrostis curvula]
MAEAMVYKTPELSVRLNFPPVQNNLYHVVPIGSRLPVSGQGEYCGDSGSVKRQGETLIALFGTRS